MSAVSSAGKKKTVAITQGAGMARNNWMSRFMVTAFAGVRQDFGADSRQPTADSRQLDHSDVVCRPPGVRWPPGGIMALLRRLTDSGRFAFRFVCAAWF